MEKRKDATNAKTHNAKKPVAPPPAEEEQKPHFQNAFTLFYPSWDAVKSNAGAIIGLTFTPILASIPIFFIVLLIVFAFSAAQQGGSASPAPYAAGIVILLVYLAMAVLGLVVSAGIVVASLKAARGEKIKYGAAFTAGRRNFWRFTGLCILVTLAVLVGFVLLIVPGLFMLRRYLLSPYYLIDRKMGILAAMEASAQESKRFGGVWSMLVVIFLISLVSVIPYVGWIASLAMSVAYMCAPAIRYLQISHAAGYEPKEPAVTQAA